MSKNTEAVAEPLAEPNTYQLAILIALQRLGKHIYGGTVPAGEIARRRAANKRSSRQRRLNLR